jgi:hypothetical protein
LGIATRARYPSGLREWSAKPSFVGSNPTRASNFQTEKLPRDFKPPHQICSHLKADPAAAARHRQFWQFSVHCSSGNW